ncbi:MAG: ATP-binding protein [Candidatus Sericytochromatia bacterium]|nr:ATP-binding protein [Candidatus Sericytochromatia bacterium]
MRRKLLPIGIQTFATLRERNAYYVDKTPHALRLIAEGSHYFLSRPRRFGKSLFLDTLKELFEGKRERFVGLHADQHWDWSQTHPVLRLSFGSRVIKTAEDLAAFMHKLLSRLEYEHGVTRAFPDAASRLADLIETLHDRTGRQVVVLVDEYDKPILDNLTEPERALAMREALRDLYGVLKDAEAHLRFVFITGVSKFSKVSLFSGLNNLNDITVDPAYSAICGYTDEDVDTVFAPELSGLDRERIRRWYNGYNWRGDAVYNPFDLLLLFQKREFRSYWFETGTPSFLVNLLAQRRFFTPDLSQFTSSQELLDAFEVDHIEPAALLWQAGYLSIRAVRELGDGQWFYTLGYPNREVEAALNVSLLHGYGVPGDVSSDARSRLPGYLAAGDHEGMRAVLHTLFAGIPHDWYRSNPLAQFEGFYASVFYSYLTALGYEVRVEDATNKGRIDLALRLGERVYLFEFKVVEGGPEGRALAQLQARGYAEKYLAPGLSVSMVGIEFSRTERNLVSYEVAPA